MSKPYNIFISWSGKRSEFIAEALANWLPHVLQSARPWLSSRDIDKGTQGLGEINRALGGMGLGISCLTPENRTAPWILFEAGALSKAFGDNEGRLWTYLLGDLEAKDVEPPLGQFQHTKAEKEDTRKLIHSINVAIHKDEDRLDKELLNATFNQWWPHLKNKMDAMPQTDKDGIAPRNSDEILGEILSLSRQYLPRLALESIWTTEPESLKRKQFNVKLYGDDEVKWMSGTHVIQGRTHFVVVDGDKVVAKFPKESIESWGSSYSSP